MGKNMSAKECGDCGNLIYYGGKCNCLEPVREPTDLEITRMKAEEYIRNNYIPNIPVHFLFTHIWYASTQILPNLEVQVVIDDNNAIHISSGSAGYVDFQINPVGMKLPIKCWIHTHPFGSAYFSGTDWKTVNTWKPLMETAYVLGGNNHYGYWNAEFPNQLTILEGNGTIRIQKQNRTWSEEE